jgi:hypothetical protein
MDENELLAIEARANAATPGPWEVGGYAGRDSIVTKCGPSDWPEWCRDPEDYDEYGRGHRVIIESDGGLYWRRDFERKDAADVTFCAHSRQDIPALIAEVRRLKEQLDDLRNDILERGERD